MVELSPAVLRSVSEARWQRRAAASYGIGLGGT